MEQASNVQDLADLRAENAVLRSRLADAQALIGSMQEGKPTAPAAEELRGLLAPIPGALVSLRRAFAGGQPGPAALAVLDRQFSGLARLLGDPRDVRPAARDPSAVLGDARAAARPSHVPHVLVVDDNEDAANSLAGLLACDGVRVEVAFDGPSALERIGCRVPDLVILDIGMPGMDGHEVARQVRARSDLRQPILIAMSGLGQAADRQRSLDAGFDRHLIKPVPIERFTSLLFPDPARDRSRQRDPGPPSDAHPVQTDLAASAAATQDDRAELAEADQQSSVPRALLHDLAQPLNTIACYAVAARNLVAKAAGDAAPLAHALRGIEQQILRAGEVLDQLRAHCLQQHAVGPDESDRGEGGWH